MGRLFGADFQSPNPRQNAAGGGLGNWLFGTEFPRPNQAPQAFTPIQEFQQQQPADGGFHPPLGQSAREDPFAGLGTFMQPQQPNPPVLPEQEQTVQHHLLFPDFGQTREAFGSLLQPNSQVGIPHNSHDISGGDELQ